MLFLIFRELGLECLRVPFNNSVLSCLDLRIVVRSVLTASAIARTGAKMPRSKAITVHLEAKSFSAFALHRRWWCTRRLDLLADGDFDFGQHVLGIILAEFTGFFTAAVV